MATVTATLVVDDSGVVYIQTADGMGYPLGSREVAGAKLAALPQLLAQYTPDDLIRAVGRRLHEAAVPADATLEQVVAALESAPLEV